MIACDIKSGVQYITKFEHFRELMNEEVYSALAEFLNENVKDYQEMIDDITSELSSAIDDAEVSESNCNDLDSQLSNMTSEIEDIIDESELLSKEGIIKKLKEVIR